MDPQFWHDKWDQNNIGFHDAKVNSMLVSYFAVVIGKAPVRVFVPLCGKTRDIKWLLDQGHSVIGVELSERAVIALFADLCMTPNIAVDGSLLRYSAPSIDIFVGDIFDLTPDQIGDVTIVYDRAALVALPRGLRNRYGPHVHALTRGAAQLLLCFEYDQSLMAGPPFSVDGHEIARIYGQLYVFDPVARIGPLDGFNDRRSKSSRSERTVWHLHK